MKKHTTEYRLRNNKYAEKWRKKNVIKNRERQQKYYYENIDKIKRHKKKYSKTHNKLNREVKSGGVKRPTSCSCCKSKRMIQGHHRDYNKPLQVIWLCCKCHAFLHSQAGGSHEER